ncbi:hypothetical protein MNBD_NITROSPINAE04-1702 [hydrothermal vent metagenome]|uniref:YeeE/YedE family protein n=2 Tax=hydrothermal vent metagenome TaxID=652676 RepID=A0A3B1CJ31_9ZZZZ
MEAYRSIFKKQWAPLTAGILIGFINTLMFAFDSPWAVFTGLRNWGLHLLEFLGAGDVAQRSPLEYTTSVMDIAFLMGAFGAALMANQFGIRIPPLREALKGFIGGVLMGIGANFARGCTIGGFYSSIAAMSVSGLYMMLGLFIGVIIGLKYLLWENRRASKSGFKAGRSFGLPGIIQIPLGLLVLVAALVIIPYYYDYDDLNELAVIFAFSAALGVINQRSRFCIVRAIRDPFMTGDGEMTKGLILALVVAITGFTVIKFAEIREAMVFINSSAGWPAILGGIIFGIGMTIAGGCASGSLWRAGEGQVKLMLAVLGFALSAAGGHLILNLVFDYSYVKRIFLPDVFDSWLVALGILFGIMFIWYLVTSWNEKTEKLVILK